MTKNPVLREPESTKLAKSMGGNQLPFMPASVASCVISRLASFSKYRYFP